MCEDSRVLNNVWNLYFHDPNEMAWDISSYIHLDTVKSVDDWVKICRIFSDYWDKGMFFLMRNDIKPLWEDDYNKNGGCISFKLFKNEIKDCWFELTCKTIGEVLVNISEFHKISGVSISSKRSYCIVRIWVFDDSLKNSNMYDIKLPAYRKMIFKSHSENKDYKDEEV